jgi:alpha-mannosidase
MLDNLDLAGRHPNYKFEAESVTVARKFVERHPERLAELQRLAREGRFAVSGAGENIVDGNMPLGESLVRNFVTGLLWVEETLGMKTRLANRADAFGNCAQLPQILLGCEFEAVEHLSYTTPRGDYWRGLDGSTIVCRTVPVAGGGGGNAKYAPCPECDGLGCRKCRGRGFDDSQRAAVPEKIDTEAVRRAGCGIVMSSPEELLPNPALVDWVRRARSGLDVRFALQEETLAHVAERIAAADRAPKSALHPSVELNPNNSGCWVTRIKTKQTCRRQEYALLGAETLATLASLAGGAYPRAALASAWQHLLFTQFHDALTATHVDPAYEELQDIWRSIDTDTARVRDGAIARLTRPRRGALAVINAWGQPSGVQEVEAVVAARSENVVVRDGAGEEAPVIFAEKIAPGQVRVRFVAPNIGPFSVRNFQVTTGAARPAAGKLGSPGTPIFRLAKATIQSKRFRVEADEHGIVAIYDKRLHADVAAQGAYRPAELILEHDEGSPWATLHPDQTRTSLAEKTRLVAAEKGAGFERLVFEVPMTGGGFGGPGAFAARLVVTLLAGSDRVDFRLHVGWETFNHRLRVAMPVPFAGKHIYGVPYGSLERKPYEPTFNWIGANGDWPAVNWAGVEEAGAAKAGGRSTAKQAGKAKDGGKVEEGGRAVVLMSKGLPSYRIEPAGSGRAKGSTIFLSVLRSPVIPAYLHEPEFYTMTDYGGMRDAGEHDFEFALASYPAFWDVSALTDAEAYNAGLIVAQGEALCDADGRLPGAPAVTGPDGGISTRPAVRLMDYCIGSARLSAFKRAEQGRGLILRLAEYRGTGGGARVTLPPGARRVEKVNLLERAGEPLPIEDGAVTLTMKAYEIATLRVTL